MRTVYLGTSPFAAAVLTALADSPHRPALVVTRPDRPRGRGRRVQSPPVADAAAQLGLPVDQPGSVNGDEARARIADAAPDALVVCAFGALIKEPLLSDFEILNVHPSLLPRWRGAAPIERAIMAGDERTGISIMRLTAGLDSGPVAATAATPIAAQDTFGTLSARLQDLGARELVATLNALPAGAVFAEQPEAGVTYAEKIAAEDRILDPAHGAEVLERTVRALSPHIGAAAVGPGGERLGVWEATARPAQPGDPPAGELSFAHAVPVLGCARETALELHRVQPAGKQAMDGAAYVRGRR